MPLPDQLSVQELKRRLDQGHQIVLLDVREPEEVALVRIDGCVHIPMAEIPNRIHELAPQADIVVYCHHGLRSASVAGLLRRQAFSNVANLTGGIDAWAALIDPRLARY